MPNNRRDAVLAAAAFGWSIPFTVAVGLIFLPSPTAKTWWYVAFLALVVMQAVAMGRFILRWRAMRAKVPDGPEADYHDADQPDRP
jgi:hypothetical protein